MGISKAYARHLKEQAETAGGAAVIDEGQPQASATAELRLLPLVAVHESPDNARKTFDEIALAALGDSMRADGINQVPVQVRPDPTPNGGYILLDGARRYRALNLIGAEQIKAEIVTQPMTDANAFRLSVLANLNREDLNPIDKGAALQQLLDYEFYENARAMAQALGLHERGVLDLLSLAKLIDAARAAVVAGKLPLSHAVLIAREDAVDQDRMLLNCFFMGQVISEKALRDWVKAHLRARDVSDDQPAPADQPAREGDRESELAAASAKERGEVERDMDDLTPEQRAAVQPAESEAREQLEADARPVERRMEARQQDAGDPVAISRTADQRLNKDWRRRVLQAFLQTIRQDGMVGHLAAWMREEWRTYYADYYDEGQEIQKLCGNSLAGDGIWGRLELVDLVRLAYAMKYAGELFSPAPGVPTALLAAARNAGVKTEKLYEEARAAEAGITPNTSHKDAEKKKKKKNLRAKQGKPKKKK